MEQMLTYDPTKRPTAEQVLKHPFFKGMNGSQQQNGPPIQNQKVAESIPQGISISHPPKHNTTYTNNVDKEKDKVNNILKGIEGMGIKSGSRVSPVKAHPVKSNQGYKSPVKVHPSKPNHGYAFPPTIVLATNTNPMNKPNLLSHFGTQQTLNVPKPVPSLYGNNVPSYLGLRNNYGHRGRFY